jgi:hypothetical protein
VRSLLKFFSLTYILSWCCFIAFAALSGSTAWAVPAAARLRSLLLYIGIFAPSLVALGLTAQAEGRAGALALLRRLHHAATGAWPRFGNEAWYVMAVDGAK